MPVALVSAIWLAWSNSFTAPLVLDDVSSITENSSIRDLGSFRWLNPPASSGETVSGRPLLNFTFALNYAVSGTDVGSYHTLNLIVHTLSALCLFGIIRITLGRLSGKFLNFPDTWIALAISALWALHPLQTAAVTYLSQRAESLTALWMLGSLYCFVRTLGSSSAWRWKTVSVVFAFLAAATKETAVVLPAIILLYDRTFVSDSFLRTWQVRRSYYLGLTSTWLLVALLVLTNAGRGGSAGFGSDLNAWSYLLTQSKALCYYLGKIFCPVGLIFDQGTPVAASLRDVGWQALVVISLLVISIILLRRRPVVGFLASTFFLLLAPSSSFVPVATQTIADHRVYLALIVPVIFLVYGLYHLGRAMFLTLTLVVAIALGAATFARNAIYQSAITLWADTTAKAPNNPRAHNNLGSAYADAGESEKAKASFRAAIALNSRHAFAHFNLGAQFIREQNWREATSHFEAAIAADPRYVSAHINLALALSQLGRTEEAIRHYQAAIGLEPQAHDARVNLAELLVDVNRTQEALGQLRIALQASPSLPEAHYQLARALEKDGDSLHAEQSYRTAIQLRKNWALGHLALANNLAQQGKSVAAQTSYRDALANDTTLGDAYFGLGNLSARQQNFAQAAQLYAEAIKYSPQHFQAHANLGNCYLALGRAREAIASYEQALVIKPNDAATLENLRISRDAARQGF